MCNLPEAALHTRSSVLTEYGAIDVNVVGLLQLAEAERSAFLLREKTARQVA